MGSSWRPIPASPPHPSQSAQPGEISHLFIIPHPPPPSTSEGPGKECESLRLQRLCDCTLPRPLRGGGGGRASQRLPVSAWGLLSPGSGLCGWTPSLHRTRATPPPYELLRAIRAHQGEVSGSVARGVCVCVGGYNREITRRKARLRALGEDS